MSYEQYKPSGFGLLPDVVKNLLIINGLVFLATIVTESALGFDLLKPFALYHWSSDSFKPYQFITHLFLHGGFVHVFFNMFALWMFGNMLENVWGGKRFFIYYMITGIGAAAIHLLFASYQIYSLEAAATAYSNTPSVEAFSAFVANHVPGMYIGSFRELLDAWMYDPYNNSYAANSISMIGELVDLKRNIPMVGASGAVFGLLLAFGMMFPNSVIYIYFALPIKAKYFVMLYGALELYSGIQNNPADNVAHFAHLGGMFFGFIMIKLWKNKI